MPDIQKSRKILFLNKEKTGSYQSRIAPEAATKRANLMIASRSVRRGIGRERNGTGAAFDDIYL